MLWRRGWQSASADPVRREQGGRVERAEAPGADILTACVKLGGVLTGEHVVDRADLMGEMFTEVISTTATKCADPDGLLNPGKVFPQLHRLCRAWPDVRDNRRFPTFHDFDVDQ